MKNNLKREKKIAIKVLRYRHDTIFTKLRVVKFKIDKMDNWGEIEKDGVYGHTYKVNYAKGLNWFNPLTYLIGIGLIIIFTAVAFWELMCDGIEECKEHLYSETIDIKDAEQVKMNLKDKEK